MRRHVSISRKERGEAGHGGICLELGVTVEGSRIQMIRSRRYLKLVHWIDVNIA